MTEFQRQLKSIDNCLEERLLSMKKLDQVFHPNFLKALTESHLARQLSNMSAEQAEDFEASLDNTTNEIELKTTQGRKIVKNQTAAGLNFPKELRFAISCGDTETN